MLVHYKDIPNDSRIWIYASDHILSNEHENVIKKKIEQHIINWKSHKSPLTAAVTILENHFIIILLDDSKNSASGCSIDSLQRIILELELHLEISLTNRLNIFCRIDDMIHCYHSSRLHENANSETLFYDLTIQRKSELEYYLKPISNGWCAHLV